MKDDVAFKTDETRTKELIDSTTKGLITTNGLYNYCKGRKFIEEFAYVPKEVTIVTEEVSKIVIRYIEVE